MPLTQNGVLTEEAMIAYLNGSLTPDATAQFEQLIADDPFAREALEGLQTTTVPQLQTTLKELHHNIAEKSGAAEPVSTISVTTITRYAIAAVLIGVLVGVAFLITNYISNNQSTPLALNTDDEQSEIAEAKPLMEDNEPSLMAAPVDSTSILQNETELSFRAVEEEVAAKEPESLKDAQPETPKKAEQVAAEKVAAEKLLADKKVEEQKKNAALAKEQTEKKALTGNAITTTGSAAANTAVQSASAPAAKAEPETARDLAAAKTRSDDRDQIATDNADNMDAAMQNFNKRNYKAAAKQFNKIADKEPENIDALYFYSVSEFLNGNSAKAGKGFDKILDKNQKHIDGSKYYKAQILLNKGKKEDAYLLFDEVSRGNSSFKQRATEKLGEIR